MIVLLNSFKTQSQNHLTYQDRDRGHILNNKAHEVAIDLARDMSGITCKDLGEYFGGVSGALITMMHNRIANDSKRNKSLKGRVANIKNQIFKI